MTTLVSAGVVSPTGSYPREPYHRPNDSKDNQFIPINQNHSGCDASRRMDDEEVAKDTEDADEEDEEEEEIKTVTSDDANEQRAKNKRKNFQPRSIQSEEKLNRRKGAATPQKCLKPQDLSVRENNDETDSDGSDSSRPAVNLKTFRKVKTERDEIASGVGMAGSLLGLLSNDTRFNNPYGIDLSKFSRHGYGDAAGSRRGSGEPTTPLPGEAKAMKEFAENTMRELLSVYGLTTTEMNEPITKNVDLSNFSAGKILEKYNVGRLPRHHPRSPLSQPPTPPHTPLSPQQAKRHCESPQDDPSDSDLADRLRHMSENGLPPRDLQALYPQTLLSYQENSKDCDGGDSPPLFFSTSLMTDPKGSFLSSSPNREKIVVNIDYSKYVRRFNSSADCSNSYCKDLNYREHFHCLDCTARVFVKKEEMIRHFKWHKKRDESLQHGFMRYSPMDDCSEKYNNCQHNRKQTHYHCVHESCDKTYISTSDVQMHANYHRKDSAIIQEGFQRFRATEECQTNYCAFYGQRTTHFHCRRDNCQYTFKNKADMEKHKSYHIKDEQLSKDGFKKFMKNEVCGYENCRFSRISNHIHCIRTNCSYVLHSSGQLLSHKRKHERMDSEQAYRKFKLTQSVMKSLQDGVPLNLDHLDLSYEHSQSQASNGEYSSDGGPSSPPILPPGFQRFGLHGNFDALPPPHFLMQSPSFSALQKIQLESIQKIQEEGIKKESEPERTYQATMEFMEKYPELMLKSPDILNKLPEILRRPPIEPIKSEDRNASIGSNDGDAGPMDLSNDRNESKTEEVWSKYLRPFAANEQCIDFANCEDAGKDHFHCIAEGCRIVFRTKDAVREHGRNHAEQDRVSGLHFVMISDSVCSFDGECDITTKHYHCTWAGCNEVVLPTDSPFLRLDHARQHEMVKRHDPTTPGRAPNPSLATSLDAMFRRKRGRPPKNRIIEVWDDNNHANGSSGMSHDSPQAIFTSFKLPKPSLTISRGGQSVGSSMVDLTSDPPVSPPENSGSSPVPMDGFFTSDGETPCADHGCQLPCQHIHCAHPRCVFSTDRPASVASHREFHSRVDVLDQFFCFDRSADCRAQACLHNKIARHFHCMRPGCNFSFLRPSTMLLHDSNHVKHGEGEIPLTRELEHEQQGEPEQDLPSDPSSPSSSLSKNTVKASGTFYPIPSSHNEDKQKSPRVQQSPENLSRKDEPTEFKVQPASPSKLFPPTGSNFILNPHFGDPRSAESDSQNPLSKLMRLQNEAARSLREYERQKRDTEPAPREVVPDYMTLEKHTRYGPMENCSRPFCKLKRKDHFHCNACNQAFSDVERLRHHIARHSSGAMSPGLKRETEDNNNDDSTEDSHSNTPVSSHAHSLPSYDFDAANPFNHPFGGFPLAPGLNAAFAQQLNLMQGQGMLFQPSAALYGTAAGLMFGPHGLHPHHPLANGLHPAMLDMEQAQAMHQHLTNLSLAANPGKRSHSPQTTLPDISMEAKKARVQNSMRILKDEPVPEGYVRYRFNEDCKYPHCGYREHQTHFHCMRKDCGYSFCDKTRFVQHTARHERLDTLMGGDFQQYRANVSCSRPDCVYANSLGTVQNKASHFHCIKCDFVCTDTNKVVAHRRQHQKLDSINAAGFEKYTPSQACNTEGCSHSGKQTHYHCLSCHYAVLGLSQMSAHKYRHMD